MTELVKYEAAKRALMEAKNVDEVKDIRDKAMALQLYAKQAKDKGLEQDAVEIRMRAERRLGEMMAEQPKAPPVNPKPPKERRGIENPDVRPITLDEAGIDKNLAKRARTAARIPEKKFEDGVVLARDRVGRPTVSQMAKAQGIKVTTKKPARAYVPREMTYHINCLYELAEYVFCYDPETLKDVEQVCNKVLKAIADHKSKEENITWLRSS